MTAKRSFLLYPFVFAMLALGPASLVCAQAGADTSGPTLRLGEAVRRALEANLGIRIGAFAPRVAEESVAVERAAFDVELVGNANAGETERASIADVTQGTNSDFRTVTAGANKRFSTGARAEVTTDLSRASNNAQTTTSQLDYNSEIGLSLTQPLLRGAWSAVNLAPIEQAESALSAARLRFNQQVFDVVAEVETAYWNLSFAYERLALRNTSLRTADILLEETREKERVGLATRVDLLQAEANRAQRLEEIILAEQAIADAADALFRALGSVEGADAFIDGSSGVRALPEALPELKPFDRIWTDILRWDLDLAIQNEVIRQRNLDELLARDIRDPRLDLTLSAGQLGRDDQAASTAVENAINADGTYWRAGLRFSVPWGRREGEARVRQAAFRREQEEIRVLEIKQELLEEARERWREAETGRRRFAAATTTLDLREATYEQAQARYEAGLITFREVLEAQEDLDAARLSALNTKIGVIRASVALDRLDGTIGGRYGLSEYTLEE